MILLRNKRAAGLDLSVLSQDVQNLYHILTFPVVQGEGWKDMHAAIEQLTDRLNGYVEHFKIENTHQKNRQSSLQPVCTPLQN